MSGLVITEVTTPEELAAARALREAVFVLEQGVDAALEWDGRDGEARHLLARLDGRPAGTLRWRILGDTAKIERVCVDRGLRGHAIGRALMDAALAHIRATPGIAMAKLGAQVAVIGFYEGLGFAATGPVFEDAGIPHRWMHLVL